MPVVSCSSRLRTATALLLFAATCVGAQVLEFADAGDLERYFSIRSTREGGGAAYVWSPAVGAGAEGGRVDVLPVADGSTSVLFSNFSFDLNLAAATASFLFQGSAASEGGVPRIALLLDTQREAKSLAAFSLKTVWVQDGYGDLPARLQAGTDGANAQTQRPGLTMGNWYQLVARWTFFKGEQAIRLEAALWDYGSQGTSAVGKVAEISALITDSALFGAGGVVSPLYLGIVAQNGLGGASALDSVRVDGAMRGVLIPEPLLAAWGPALAGCGAVLSVVWLRRRLRVH